MSKIELDRLKGKKVAIRVVRKVTLQGDTEATNMNFGFLQEAFKKIGDQEFQLQGYIGPQGKSFPVFAQVIADPGKSQADKDRPALRIFRFNDAELFEYAIGFRHIGTTSKKEFYSGNTTIGPKMDLTFFTVDKKEEEELQGELEGQQ